MNALELQDFLRRNFPNPSMQRATIEEARPSYVRFRYAAGPKDLRPGGTVSGPAMMTLCDTAMYLAMVATDGPQAGGFTTNINIDFLRKPQPGELQLAASILKQGKHLLVGQVEVCSDGIDGPVAVATLTYALP